MVVWLAFHLTQKWPSEIQTNQVFELSLRKMGISPGLRNYYIPFAFQKSRLVCSITRPV
jgi:hypothetical protein